MLEIEPTQQWIRRYFGRAKNIASAVGFDVGKRQELPQPTIDVAPHPSVDWTHQPVQRRTTRHGRHDGPRPISIDVITCPHPSLACKLFDAIGPSPCR